jgi:hypothetical protein
MNSWNYLRLTLVPLAAGTAFASEVLVSPALAGTRDDVMSAATRCAGITDDRSWLDCYYGAAQPMRAQLGLASAPASQTAKVPPAQAAARVTSAAPTAPPAKNGFLDGLFGSSGEKATMVSYHFDDHGKFTVTLSNGQIWQQLAYDGNTAHWREAASRYRVSIAEGSDHAELTVVNDGEVYGVRRAN